MASEYYAQIQKMVKALPTGITTQRQIEQLPWGGNAAWDCPIILHLEKDLKPLPARQRKKLMDLAFYLQMGIGPDPRKKSRRK